jgi:hypothetical protein
VLTDETDSSTSFGVASRVSKEKEAVVSEPESAGEDLTPERGPFEPVWTKMVVKSAFKCSTEEKSKPKSVKRVSFSDDPNGTNLTPKPRENDANKENEHRPFGRKRPKAGSTPPLFDPHAEKWFKHLFVINQCLLSNSCLN